MTVETPARPPDHDDPEALIEEAWELAHRRRRRRAVAAALTVGILAGGVSYAIATAGGHPRVHRGRVARSDVLACTPAALQRLARGAPPPALLAALGILRPAQTADRLSSSAAMIGPFRRGGAGDGLAASIMARAGGTASGISNASLAVYSRYVRRARTFFGLGFYVIPIVADGRDARTGRCLSPLSAVSLESIGGFGNEGGCCEMLSDILAGRGRGAAGIGARGALVSFIVPDGVAAVTLKFPRARAHPTVAHPPPSRRALLAYKPISVTTRPHGNVVAVIVPRSAPDAFDATVVWRSPTGAAIKTVRPAARGG
jgi:hypothetical protein